MSREPLTDRQKYIQALTRQQLQRRAQPYPNPRRITMALDLRELYGPEVDRACGVQEPAVDLWETGDLVPTAEQVAKLAQLTGFPVVFFYQPDPIEVGPMWVCQGRGKGRGCHLVTPDVVHPPRQPHQQLLLPFDGA